MNQIGNSLNNDRKTHHLKLSFFYESQQPGNPAYFFVVCTHYQPKNKKLCK